MAQRSALSLRVRASLPISDLCSYSPLSYIIPGSHVIARYAESSHQNDPGRTVLLALFAIRTLLQCVPAQTTVKSSLFSFLKEQSDLASVSVVSGANGPAETRQQVLNLVSYKFTGLAIKVRVIETLRKYGVGSCGPPGFYGTIDVHMDLERDIADFLGTEASILYSQGSSTMPCVISAFAKRDDISVTDQGVNFAIEGLANFAFYDVLVSVEKERRKRRGPLTRRFIITEGIFEKDGAMVDLPKHIELKHKQYRLILDESISFDTVGRTGRGLTELYNVPFNSTAQATQLDMIVGSVANGLSSSEEFLRGLRVSSWVTSASTARPPQLSLLTMSAKPSNPAPREAPSFGFVCEEHLLRDIVGDAGTQTARAGAWLRRSRTCDSR
ncbi:serine palmitoyltransferase [Lactarius hengduanensis]|nr:serine palmitoyltransferase [Lactarius hengduanensis]